ncbi:ABC transporter ATP-binding protein [Methylobacterium sp. sgz302541]|uniref:ABC transporter ATP-binding protein n=1 Tax=unclassified Methylobacterium TaxID=2615210 RepID=UPI003D330437
MPAAVPPTDALISRESAGGAAPALLSLRDLSCRFGAVRALDGVCLDVAHGEIVGLLGDSGCGKSTLLRVVAGLETATAGEVVLDGRLLGPQVPPEARGVGLMFQDYALFPHLTVAQNVRFGLSGRDRARADAVVAERLAQVGLSHRAGTYPETLSGGEAQRTALARALAPRPLVLLLDEPFSNLDRRMRERVRADTLAVLRAAGATALLVTHDPDEALDVCDRIALMRAGRIEQAGRGEELYRRPVSLFAARFLGDLAEAEGRCAAGFAETPLGRFPAPGFPEGARVTVGLRPEAIRLGTPGEGIGGSVLRRRFRGASDSLDIAVEGLAEPLRLTARCDEGPLPGARVELVCDAGGALIFASAAD